MKHSKFTKALAVLLSVVLLVTTCIVYASAECAHENWTWERVTYPDCRTETDGYLECVCDDCGEVINTHTDPWQTDGHNYSAYDIVNVPTCDNKGKAEVVCYKCGESSGEYVELPNIHDGFNLKDHCLVDEYGYVICDYAEYVVWSVTTPATCTQPGVHSGVCRECGAKYVPEQIDPLGHKSAVYEDWLDGTNYAHDYIGYKNVAYVAPTCTEAGSITFQCDVCGEPVRVFEQEALGHYNAALTSWDYCFENDPDFGSDEDLLQYVEWYNVDYKPATCTESGVVTFKCSVCQTVMRTMTLKAHGHRNAALEEYYDGSCELEDCIGEADVAYKAPTCTEPGSVTFRCNECQIELRTYELAALGHTEGYTKVITAATCTTAGEKGTYCADCDKLMKTETIDALGHDYGSWYKNGDHLTHSRACSRCMFKETANCEYSATVTPATCTEGGYTTYVCPVCSDAYKDDFTDPLGHDYGAWTDDGDETHTHVCARCGDSETEAHCFGEWEYNRDAKFFKNGTKSCTCEVCGKVVTEKAKFTAWIWHPLYPILLFVGSVTHKAVYLGSLAWFLPWLNIQPKM
ncbi:MAG: hypothetical protein IKW76_03405 [Clostridia bacterium]|nr:hypothetical protein [Clostridia bacterium]